MTRGLFTIHQDGRAEFKKAPKWPPVGEANKKAKGLSCKSARTERRSDPQVAASTQKRRWNHSRRNLLNLHCLARSAWQQHR